MTDKAFFAGVNKQIKKENKRRGYEEETTKIEDLSLDELKTIVYELGIDEAYENPAITKGELLDYYYDYSDND